MIPQIVDIKTTNKTDREILLALVDGYNVLAQQVTLALQNIDMSDVVSDVGLTLDQLIKSGALKGEQGIQGNPGRVWRPTVDANGNITWALTDTGGTIPPPTNIKGPAGEPGTPGTPGTPGAAGVGVPAGGLAGQVLVKASDDDFDTEWRTIE